MSEVCCACGTSSIGTTPDCKKVFEAYARIFVCVNTVTSVTCVDSISMNLVYTGTPERGCITGALPPGL